MATSIREKMGKAFADAMRVELTKLMTDTEQAIRNVIADHSQDPEKYRCDAVNWADLHCIRAGLMVDNEGEIGFMVFIEELAPDCMVFHSSLQDNLYGHGWNNVEIYMEW